jgi:ParB-like chromosome segregation protein Spo0J
MTAVLLSKIRYDEDCQSRVRLDEETVAEYAHRMKEGATFPLVTVFFDGSEHWLADGYHRFAAAKVLAREAGADAAEILADVQQGTRLDAVRHALAANSQHGKRREAGDYRKGYEIAVRCGLCEPTDTSAVRTLLACSDRWARELTMAAREMAERERNDRIAASAAAGETQRQIAAREGLSHRGIGKVLGNQRRTAVGSQPSDESTEPVLLTSTAQDGQYGRPSEGSPGAEQQPVAAPPPCEPISPSHGEEIRPAGGRKPEGEVGQGTSGSQSAAEPERPMPPQDDALAEDEVARLREVQRKLNADTAGSLWSHAMTLMGDAADGISLASHHRCPVVMAPKARRLIHQLENCVSSLKEMLPHDDAH